MRVLRISHSAVVDAWRERERAIARRGVKVRLLTARTWDEGGAPVPLEPRPGEPVEGVPTVGTHPALFLYDPRPIWRALGEGWDVLDIHEEPFALATAEVLLLRALRRHPAPYVLYSAQNLDKRLPAPFRWLQRRILRNAQAVSVCNVAAGELVRRRGFSGVADLIPLGIELDGLDSPARRAPGRVVGYAGRLAPHKGVDVLLDAVAAIPSATLRIAGAGPAAETLRRRAAQPDLAGRVVFDGSLAGAALQRFYREIDVLAVPSLTTPTWVEQFGRVAVEGMAHGVPVVASDSGALPDIVGGAGLLVPPGEVEGLRAALVRVLDDPDLAAALRAAGAVRARSCDWETVGDRYVEMYRRVTHTPTADESERRVEVVVVAYGAPGHLGRALAALDGLPVTVVDNSSSAAVEAVCRERGVRYVDPGRNLGFGAGVNLALADRLVPDADVLLLNPDAQVAPADIHRLHLALLANPRLASVAPRQVDEEGNHGRVAWPFPSPARTWATAVGLTKALPSRAGFAIGAVLLLRREALQQVGGFDEDFFLYAEETDWARRAHQLRWRHAVVPTLTAVHTGAASSTDPSRREAHFHGAQERYLRKHHGAVGWQVARLGLLGGSAARSLVLRGERGLAARRRLQTYAAGPLRVERRFGRGAAS